MPFHVYEGLTGRLITTVIRPGKTPSAAEILAVLKRIVKKIRERFPQTQLLFRADSHHTKPQVMDWLEENRVEWFTGLAPNKAVRQRLKCTTGKRNKVYHLQGQPRVKLRRSRFMGNGISPRRDGTEAQRHKGKRRAGGACLMPAWRPACSRQGRRLPAPWLRQAGRQAGRRQLGMRNEELVREEPSFY